MIKLSPASVMVAVVAVSSIPMSAAGVPAAPSFSSLTASVSSSVTRVTASVVTSSALVSRVSRGGAALAVRSRQDKYNWNISAR